jgi:hypothetical protein
VRTWATRAAYGPKLVPNFANQRLKSQGQAAAPTSDRETLAKSGFICSTGIARVVTGLPVAIVRLWETTESVFTLAWPYDPAGGGRRAVRNPAQHLIDQARICPPAPEVFTMDHF